eukprot:CAMPEP_0196739780 /NCGR_PEP_ID=MMETSP1091-20130531/25829_1 /TAXON_ID=302021 /ORGANISM="Rhodomonas sp., Strain CCMP768" /LENGTH=98 /DNA_ID=CAMNT_0042084541 /DNA_START=76 /DNA_END=372 /DNA_ORIENTATION=+
MSWLTLTANTNFDLVDVAISRKPTLRKYPRVSGSRNWPPLPASASTLALAESLDISDVRPGLQNNLGCMKLLQNRDATLCKFLTMGTSEGTVCHVQGT